MGSVLWCESRKHPSDLKCVILLAGNSVSSVSTRASWSVCHGGGGAGAIPLLHPIASSSQTLASGTVDPIHLEFED